MNFRVGFGGHMRSPAKPEVAARSWRQIQPIAQTYMYIVVLCDTTPRRTLVATNRLWCMAACAWHEPPADTCSVVSASHSHPINKNHNS